MTDGITAMWDDAKHYEELAEYYNVPVQCNGMWPGMWPYYMDTKHYEELKARYVGEERMKTPDYEKIREEIHEKHSESFKALYISELKDQIADKDEVITAQDHIIAEQKAEIDQNRIDLEEYRLDVERLEAALREIKELPGELNPSNYTHDDVVTLNDAFVKTWQISRAALEERT